MKWKFLVIGLLVVLVSGCVKEKISKEQAINIAKTSKEVKEFLDKYPQTDIHAEFTDMHWCLAYDTYTKCKGDFLWEISFISTYKDERTTSSVIKYQESIGAWVSNDGKIISVCKMRCKMNSATPCFPKKEIEECTGNLVQIEGELQYPSLIMNNITSRNDKEANSVGLTIPEQRLRIYVATNFNSNDDVLITGIVEERTDNYGQLKTNIITLNITKSIPLDECSTNFDCEEKYDCSKIKADFVICECINGSCLVTTEEFKKEELEPEQSCLDKYKDTSKYGEEEVNIGFPKNISEIEVKYFLKRYNLTLLEYGSMDYGQDKNILIHTVGVPNGSEISWVCKLNTSSRVKYADLAYITCC